MDNTESAMLGGLAGFLAAMLVGFFLTTAAVEDVENRWCHDKGGKFVDGKCFEDYKEIELK